MQDNPAVGICSVSGCGARLRATNTIGRCREHAYVPAVGAICGVEGCGTPLRKDNRTGFCTPHRRAKDRGPVPKRDVSGRVYPDRKCADCPVVFIPASATHERCPECQHRHRLALRAEREGRNQRDTCSVDGCDAKLRTSNTIGRCSDHRYIPVVSAVCGADGCEQALRKDNDTGYCKAHKYATARAPVRVCAADGCENELRGDNQSGYCAAHAWQTASTRASRDRLYAILREQAERRRQQRPECSVDGCDRRVRSDNTSGRCNDHIYVPLDLAACSADGCENRITARNTTGRCMEHVDWRAVASAWAAANPEARQASSARRRGRVQVDMDATDRLLSTLYRQAIKGDPCYYCGSPVTHHVDHFFPLAKGGTDHFWNLVRACERDNLSKHAQCGTAYLLRRGRL